jgi:hypothetical protein
MRVLQTTPAGLAPLVLMSSLWLTACAGTADQDVASRDAALDSAPSVQAPLADSAVSVSVTPPSVTPVAAPVAAPAVASPAPAEAPRPRRAATPRPAAAAPAGPPPAPAPVTPAAPAAVSGAIASGTSFSVTNGAKVCSSTLTVGDRVTTTLAAPVAGSNGVALPAGARVALVVTKSKTSGAQGDAAALEFDVRSVTFGGETYPIVGSVSTEAVVTERKGGDAKKVAVGAAAGAVIGNIIGGGSRAQRTVVGAAAGGLAGAATAAMTGDRFACLPDGASLTVRLGSALNVRN